MDQAIDPAALYKLFDREAIRDCLMRYCRGIDRCDEGALLSVYWPDAIDDHGLSRGNGIDFARAMLRSLPQRHRVTSHLLGNILIELEGNRARVESYFQAFHAWYNPDRDCEDVLLGGRYLDLMEKRNNEWRILHRRVVFDWSRCLGQTQEWDGFPFGAPPMDARAGREPEDPLYPDRLSARGSQ